MVVGYILASMWLVGCVVAPLWAAIVTWQDDDNLICFLVLSIGLPLGCLLGILPWALIAENRSPDLATLKKNEWVCSASHVESSTTYVMSGKIMVPITSNDTVCDQYNRG